MSEPEFEFDPSEYAEQLGYADQLTRSDFMAVSLPDLGVGRLSDHEHAGVTEVDGLAPIVEHEPHRQPVLTEQRRDGRRGRVRMRRRQQ